MGDYKMNKSIISNIVPGIITFFAGIISSIIANVVYDIPAVTYSIMAATCFAVIAILAHVYSNRKTSCNCCGIETIGLLKVFPFAKKSIKETLQTPSKSFRFLGVSAEFVVNSDIFKKVVKKKITQEDCRFEFLLLSPNATTALRQHAASEGVPEGELRDRIKLFSTVLQVFGSNCRNNIDAFFYEELPIFRLVFVDDDICYVSYYGAKGKKGIDTPQLMLRKTNDSLYNAFSNYYTELRAKSVLNSNNKSLKSDVD